MSDAPAVRRPLDLRSRLRTAVLLLDLVVVVLVNGAVAWGGIALLRSWGWPEGAVITAVSIICLIVLFGGMVLSLQLVARLFSRHDDRVWAAAVERLRRAGLDVDDAPVADESCPPPLPQTRARPPHPLARLLRAVSPGRGGAVRELSVWHVSIPLVSTRSANQNRSIVWTVLALDPRANEALTGVLAGLDDVRPKPVVVRDDEAIRIGFEGIPSPKVLDALL